jgi:hypothetical protein
MVEEKGGAMLEDALGTPLSKTTGYFDFSSRLIVLDSDHDDDDVNDEL